MEHAQLDSKEWSHIVARLGGEEALASSAREHRAFIRARGVKSAVDVLRLALIYGPGGHSLRTVAAMASAAGLAEVSDVAVLDRLKGAADWLQSLCKERLARVAKEIGVKPMERPIRLAVTPGEIRLGDRGFPQPDGIRNTLAAGADVLVRLTWNSLQMTADGKPIDWLKLFKRASEQSSLDMSVRVHKAHSRFEPLDMRLVIIKKPPAAAAQARTKARRASRKNNRRTDPRTLAGADYVILLTSLKRQEFPIDLVAALYRLRWQIELAIKRLKSILHIDRLPAKDPDLARAWLYAHLLLALLLDDIIARLGAIPPSGAARSSSPPHSSPSFGRRLTSILHCAFCSLECASSPSRHDKGNYK